MPHVPERSRGNVEHTVALLVANCRIAQDGGGLPIDGDGFPAGPARLIALVTLSGR